MTASDWLTASLAERDATLAAAVAEGKELCRICELGVAVERGACSVCAIEIAKLARTWGETIRSDRTLPQEWARMRRRHDR